MALLQCPKRLWVGFQSRAIIVLRALGLNVLGSWLRSLKFWRVKKKSHVELPKIAIRRNRLSALLRALIHAIPVTAALALITLNLYQYYVGYSTPSLALYQLVAKIHEMMIQASLAAIVFSYIRHEMVLGEGIPLGAMFSGLQLSQASYLWSTEFWGSARSKYLSPRKRGSLIAIIISSISLAAVVGPSSAILLVPRLAYWPAGFTHIWINVTSDDLWPTRTDQILVSEDCSVVNQSAKGWSCPSDEWQSIEQYLQLSNSAIPPKFKPYGDLHGDPAPDQVQITGKGSLRHLRITHLIWMPLVNSDSETAIATAQQAAVADALTATSVLWGSTIPNVTTGGHGLPLEQLNAVQQIKNDYYQPYTIASCANDTIEGPNDERPLTFPIPPGVSPQNLPEQQINNSTLSYPAFPLLDMTRAEILKTPGPLRENRLRWIELPQDPFNGSAIGAVVLLPVQNPGPEESQHQDILVCNLGAGWGSSTLNTSSQDYGSSNVNSEINGTNFLVRNTLPHNVRRSYTPYLSVAEQIASASFNIFLFPFYPQRPVNVSLSWSQYLNPFLPDLNTTVFHQLMQSNLTNRDPAFKGEDAFIVDPEQSKDWVKLRVYSTYEGYAYNTDGTGPKVAITFLVIYCTFAVVHTCYAGISGISSTCWDSIGEVTALAMNSTPTSLLRNTSSGIENAKIYKLPARIFARPDDTGEGEHLELVLGEQDEKTVEQRTLKVNRVYG